MAYLLDTNVVSELSKPRPAEPVVRWIESRTSGELHLSVGVLAEIWDGIGRLAPGRRRSALEAWLTGDLMPAFNGRIEPVDAEVAEAWGLCSAKLKAAGLNDTSVDALIGATAQVRGFTIVTRNTRDFAPLRVSLIDPWVA